LDNEEIKLRFGNLSFTWDQGKAVLNFHKHGVTFEVAAEVFLDDDAIERKNHYQNETRFEIIGKITANPFLLFVVFTERTNINGEDVLRIISARRATKKERQDYEKRLWSNPSN
jgi:uncharacterized DUF497 family protein